MSRQCLSFRQGVLSAMAILLLTFVAAGFFQSSVVKAAPARLPAHVGPAHPHFFKSHLVKAGKGYTKTSSPDDLLYNGGSVMQKSSITYAIFWEPQMLQDGSASQVSPTYNRLLQRYFSDMGGSGLYSNNTQYYDSTGHITNSSTFGGAWLDSSAYPASVCTDSATPQNCLTDSQIQAEVARAMAANNWTGGLTHLFFVFTSSGEGSCTDAGSTACAFTDYCAYHSYFTGNNNQPILYANMPYTGTNLSACGVSASPNNDFAADSTINVTSHEHMEAVTDPLLDAWYDNQGNEIGDKCAWNFGDSSLDNGVADVQWNNHFYIVQQEWSNAIDGCTLSGSMQPPPASGTVYEGSNDGNVYAINTSDGSLLWHYQTGGAVFSSPSVDNNGFLYVGSKDGYVYSIDTIDGLKNWQTKTGGAVLSSPLVSGGIVYVGSLDGYLYALDSSSGTQLWRVKVGKAISSSPTIANNIVYASSSDGFLYAVNISSHKVTWRVQGVNTAFSSPTVANNIAYAGSSNGFLYAFNANKGTKLWSYKIGGSLIGTPVVTNSIVYIGSSSGLLYALNASRGTKLWSYRAKGGIVSQANVTNGLIYFGALDHYLYALDAGKGTLTWRYLTQGNIFSSPAVVDNVIYFGSDDHNIYALSATTSLLDWHYQTGGAVESSPTVVLAG